MGDSIREEHTGSSFVLDAGLPHKDGEHIAESRGWQSNLMTSAQDELT